MQTGKLAVLGAVCRCLLAQSPAPLQGQWKLSVGNSRDFSILLQFSISPDQKIQGVYALPSVHVDQAPVRSIRWDAGNLEASFLTMTFRGKLDAAGTSITGAVQSGNSTMPASMALLTRTLLPSPERAPQEAVDWLRSQAIPLETVEPGHGVADLRRLRAAIGDARVVAMGEATHGTREFFQLKHRMFEYLVSELGFTILAVEANWPESLAVNDFVLHGAGDPEQALKGLDFWTIRSAEVVDLVRWMRAYNQDPAHTRKVKFFGFDMQYVAVAVQHVAAYFATVDPAAGHDFLREAGDVTDSPGWSNERRRQVAPVAARYLQRLEDHQADYVAHSSGAAWTQARQNAEILRQAASMLGDSDRDRFMAQNVKWILDQEPPGTKMLVWAHNNHVRSDAYIEGASPMGLALRRIYGDAFRNLGFAFYEGSFRAYEPGNRLRDFVAAPAVPYSLDAALAATGLPLFALDLRHPPPAGPAADWLGAEQRLRQIGSIYFEEQGWYYVSMRIAQAYDLLFFVTQTTAARQSSQGVN